MPKTVLIVEDNELNMKLFHDLLEAHGYQTVGTRNGIEALDLARKHKPDLILMDIQLPEVSGLEVTKWLKDDPELKVIPVVAVTAFAMKGDEERIREGGCEAYLSKPISVAKFIETIVIFWAPPDEGCHLPDCHARYPQSSTGGYLWNPNLFRLGSVGFGRRGSGASGLRRLRPATSSQNFVTLRDGRSSSLFRRARSG